MDARHGAMIELRVWFGGGLFSEMSIFEHVLTFIHRPEPERFERLALDVFRHQFASIRPYRRYCEGLGVDASRVTRLDDIPAVSNVAFKYANLSSDEGARSPDAKVFLTSGTTRGRANRGRHLVPRPEIYRASATAHLRTMLFPDALRTAVLALHPTANVMPESSLSTMVTWCIEEFGNGRHLGAASRDSVDVNAAIRFLADAESRREPVSILGTTAASAALFGELRDRRLTLRLPGGSRMMDTGGVKGQATPMSPAEVVASAGELLAIGPEMVINEYGMTELCSQLYDETPFNRSNAANLVARFKIAPPWLRVTARDPATLLPVLAGEPGLLTFFDLANVGSVSAVMTEDVGSVEGGRVRVLGRSSAGEARGCALAIEQFAANDRVRRTIATLDSSEATR